ncbi:hypothetical protein FOA52_014961 [Chlamydomonas sp. UWO 241]|nr:hypothetical protein FOA52_014961 [Chlamydomonas sp. UWO 241]
MSESITVPGVKTFQTDDAPLPGSEQGYTHDGSDQPPALPDKPTAATGNPLRRLFMWYLSFALPGLGLFSEAYIVFSVGQLGPFQKAIHPSCFVTYADCDQDLVKHVAGYIQIIGIIVGMLLWGWLADITGRKWGSRSVAIIMLSGVVMLTFTPWAPNASAYFTFFIVAQTWYGFGVGGEYPLAAASAAERSSTDEGLMDQRGRTVVLVFSNQGLGNLTNSCVILLCMLVFGQTSGTVTEHGAKNVIALMYGVGAVTCLVMVWYRFSYLEESELFAEEKNIETQTGKDTATHAEGLAKHWVSLKKYWPRQLVASGAWFANDFAFYGNKLQQAFFIGLLYPKATTYEKQQWTVLNSAIALMGYYLAALLVDKKWFGRRLMQVQGFLWMFVLFIIIYAQWGNMAVKGAPLAGTRAFQALYYLSSFFNQFGPNCTTFLVAGEMFPTDVRTTHHGFAAAVGKLGAIIASVWISFVADPKKVFLISALWGLFGALVTIIFLPETTGLSLTETDRMQRCLLEDRWDDYHGEAINPKHVSLFERFVLGWSKNYDPEADTVALSKEADAFLARAMDPTDPSADGVHQYMRNPKVRKSLPHVFERLVQATEDFDARRPPSNARGRRSGGWLTHRTPGAADKLEVAGALVARAAKVTDSIADAGHSSDALAVVLAVVQAQTQQIASLVDLVHLLVSRVPGAPMQMPHAVPHAAHSAPRAAPAAKAAQPARPAAAAAPVASAAGAPAAERPAAAGAARTASARGPSRRGGLPALVGETSLCRSHVLSIPVAAATRLIASRGSEGQMARDGIVRGALRDASYLGSTRHVRRLFSDCYGSEETAVAAAAVRAAAAAVDGVSLPVCLAMNLVRFVHVVSGRDRPAGGGVVSASFLNAKPAVGGIGVEPRRGGVLRVLFTVASDAVADTVVRSRRNLRDVDPSAAVFDVLSDREEAQHRALWPAFLAAKAAGKRAQFHRARLVVDGERVPAPAC